MMEDLKFSTYQIYIHFLYFNLDESYRYIIFN